MSTAEMSSELGSESFAAKTWGELSGANRRREAIQKAILEGGFSIMGQYIEPPRPVVAEEPVYGPNYPTFGELLRMDAERPEAVILQFQPSPAELAVQSESSLPHAS